MQNSIKRTDIEECVFPFLPFVSYFICRIIQSPSSSLCKHDESGTFRVIPKTGFAHTVTSEFTEVFLERNRTLAGRQLNPFPTSSTLTDPRVITLIK